MAYLLVRSLVSLILCWHIIDGAVLNCKVYPVVLQLIPNRIVATIAVANSSNEEIFWSHVDFAEGVQFPLNFTVVISNKEFIADTYVLQLHIYQLPRNPYDLPLWSADSIDKLERDEKHNSIIFHAFNDFISDGPCLVGVIIKAQENVYDLSGTQLTVKVGSMSPISLGIHSYVAYFPILFLITDIPTTETRNSTLVKILISGGKTIRALAASRTMEPTSTTGCSTILFRASQEPSMNLTVTLSAHVLTSISLLDLAVICRVYLDDYLLYEQSEVVDTLEFPFITRKQLVPLTYNARYTVEATVFGPIAGFTSGVTVFQGATTTRLLSGIDNNVKISMLYTGPKIGTTIIGTIRQTPPTQSTWPLVGSNLAIVVDNQLTDVSKSVQFTIFDQKFPIEFTMLKVKEITGTNQTIVFTVTITYLNGILIWEAITVYNRIIIGELNRFDINVSTPNGYGCQMPGKGYCISALTSSINRTCCSQFKCSYGQCNLQ